MCAVEVECESMRHMRGEHAPFEKLRVSQNVEFFDLQRCLPLHVQQQYWVTDLVNSNLCNTLMHARRCMAKNLCILAVLRAQNSDS